MVSTPVKVKECSILSNCNNIRSLLTVLPRLGNSHHIPPFNFQATVPVNSKSCILRIGNSSIHR